MTKKLLKHIETITGHRDTALLDKSVVTSLRELLHVTDVRLYDIAEKDGKLLIAVTTWGDAEGVHFRHDVLTDEDYSPVDQHPLIATQLAQHPGDAPSAAGAGDEESLYQFLPVRVDRQLIACIEIRYEKPPSVHQKDLAEGIFGLYRNYLSLLEDSQIDTLTGLANRKTFERTLMRLLAQSGRQPATKRAQDRRSPLDKENWLAIIDVDYFKRVNDHFGHLYGDEVLILLANLMRETFRQHDRLFRFGGEEFVVLLRQASYDDAHNALERLREKVASHAFPQVGRITVSAGFSLIHPLDTPNAVLGHADEALYFAKDQGRNQVHSYEKLVESGKLPKKHLHTEADFF
ncbi:MAG: GGDEF domain-containing protein [Rhodocyclaceae bacterium]